MQHIVNTLTQISTFSEFSHNSDTRHIRIIRELIYNLFNRHGSKQHGITNLKFLTTDVKLGIKRG